MMNAEEEKKRILSIARPIFAVDLHARKDTYCRIMGNPWGEAQSRNWPQPYITTSLALDFAKEEVLIRLQCAMKAMRQALEVTSFQLPYGILQSIFIDLYDGASESDIEQYFEQQMRNAIGGAWPNPAYPPHKASLVNAKKLAIERADAELALLTTKQAYEVENGSTEQQTMKDPVIVARDKRFALLDSLVKRLIDAAIDQRFIDQNAFAEERQAALDDPVLSGALPDWMPLCRDLSHFRAIAQSKGGYEKRREFIRASMVNAFAAAEGKVSPSSTPIMQTSSGSSESQSMKKFSRKVFVVHGHEEATREKMARFLERLDFEPIILHEQASRGRTVIEKVENHSDVGFAVVLLTPDDEGCVKGGTPGPRARQNVLLELGYFLSHLGRDRVCAFKCGEVEIPSDFDGVVYVNFDGFGGWQRELGKELGAAGFEIDWNKVMGS